jgi:hypothetical protein
MKGKCVFAIGPESTGSMLVAKVCAHVLDVAPFGEWNGVAWVEGDSHKVCHRSLPYAQPPQFPDINQWIQENRDEFDILFVLTTRDISMSEYSRIERFGKSMQQVQKESERAKSIMIDVMQSGFPFFIWSYETYMYLGLHYAKGLYDFLEVQSDFVPAIKDGNKARILSGNFSDTPPIKAQVEKYKNTLKNFIKPNKDNLKQ